MLTTIAYRIKGKTTYAMEGSIFIAGAGVQWLRDRMKFFKKASETEKIIKSLTKEKHGSLSIHFFINWNFSNSFLLGFL